MNNRFVKDLSEKISHLGFNNLKISNRSIEIIFENTLESSIRAQIPLLAIQRELGGNRGYIFTDEECEKFRFLYDFSQGNCISKSSGLVGDVRVSIRTHGGIFRVRYF